MKKIIIFLSVLAMTTAMAAWAQTDTVTLSIAANDAQMGTVTLGDTNGSIIFGNLTKGFFCTTPSQYGVCTDGTYIYTSSWTNSVSDGFMFHQYSMNGDSIDAFTIDGIQPIRDMTTDGTYFYGGANGDSVFVMDLTARIRVGAFQCQGAQVRHISYDPVRDGFWLGNWSTLALYDRNGNKIQDGPASTNIAGSAYYTNGDEGHLLLYRQPSSDALVFDYDISNDTIYADTVCDVVATSEAVGMAGGSFISTYNGRLCWFGDVQQSPNFIGIYPIVNVPTDSISKDVVSGTQWIVTATPKEGYHFVKWSDETTENPRTLEANSNIELQAIFAGNIGIDAIDVNDINVYSLDGRIVVEGAEGLTVRVYDMMGREVCRNISSAQPILHNGVYLVQVADLPAHKVVVIR